MTKLRAEFDAREHARADAANTPDAPFIRFSTEEISGALADDIENVVTYFLGKTPNERLSHRGAGKLRYGSNGSLSVTTRGPKAGKIEDYEAGDKKALAPLEFVARALGRSSVDGPVYQAALAYLGWGGGKRIAYVPKPKPVVDTSAEDQERAAKIANARANWGRSQPLVGSYAAKYLVNRTGIPQEGFEALEATGQIGFTSRYLTTPSSRTYHEGMICAGTLVDGSVQCVQVVFLTRHGTKKYPKGGNPNKKTAGPMNGAAVRLPGSGDPILVEGPEKGIAVWWATRRPVVIALGSIARIIGEIADGAAVTVCEDQGTEKQHADFIANVVMPLVDRGCRVTVAMPAQRYPDLKKTDFDDVSLRSGFDTVRETIESACVYTPPIAPVAEPHFPRPKLDGKQASRNLRRVVKRWLDVCERILEARDRRDALVPELVTAFSAEARDKLFDHIRATDPVLTGFDEITEEVERRVLARCRTAATRKAKREFGLRGSLGRLPGLQIKGSAGLGKTSAFVDEFLSRPSLWRRNIAFYVPTLKLGEALLAEIQAKIEQHGLVGPMVMTIDGRNEQNCARFKIVEAGQKKVPSAYKAFCKFGEHLCPHYQSCVTDQYLKQYEYKGPALRIFAHEHIALRQTADLRLPDADLVVVDENCLHALITKVMISPCEFTEEDTYEKGDGDSISRCLKIGKAVAGAIEVNGLETINEIFRRNVTADDLRFAAKIASEGSEQPSIIPSFTDDFILKRFEQFKANNGIKVAAIFRQLARDTEFGRKQSISVEYNPRFIIHGSKGDYEAQKVILHKIHPVTIPKRAGVCLIDADAVFDANDIALSRKLKCFTITAKRRAFVIQCTSTSLGKSTILADKLFGKGGEQAERAVSLRNRIASMVQELSTEGFRTVVQAYKPLRAAWTGETGKKLPIAADWQGAELTHFGSYLGQDRWKDFDAVVQIGREQITPQAAESMARAVYGNSVPTLALSGAYEKVDRRLDMRNGADKTVKVWVHPDPHVQQFVELPREGGSAQGVDRLRLVHTEKPKLVVVLSSVPLPGLTIDIAASLDDILSGKAIRQFRETSLFNDINDFARTSCETSGEKRYISPDVSQNGSRYLIENKGNTSCETSLCIDINVLADCGDKDMAEPPIAASTALEQPEPPPPADNVVSLNPWFSAWKSPPWLWAVWTEEMAEFDRSDILGVWTIREPEFLTVSVGYDGCSDVDGVDGDRREAG